MFPMIATGLLSIFSFVLACVVLFVALSEKHVRQRTTHELTDEIAQLKQELAVLSDQLAPSAGITPHSRRRDRGQKRASAGPLLIAIPDLAPPPRADQPIAPEFAARFGGIWELADGGACASTIAQATGQPIGRIELILALQRNRPTTREASRT